MYLSARKIKSILIKLKSYMKTLVITLFISMLLSLLTISYAVASGGKDSSAPYTGTNSLAINEQWQQFIQLVDEDDYENLEDFLKNLENKELFLKSQYAEEDDENEKIAYTPLHYASVKAVPVVIDLLLSQGVDVNAAATNQATPLHYAVSARREDAVQCLLLANASLKSSDEDKFTPLSVAILRAYRAYQVY